MNPDKPSRDDIEVKLTALLLGELPADEARLLRWTISQDAALQKLHDELESTIVLVREAEKNPAAAPGEKIEPLKLSDARREKLLAHFKTPRPQESFWIRRLEIPSLIPVLAAIAIIALLAAMLLPALSKSKSKSAHLTMLSAAKQQTLEAQMVADENLPTTTSAAPAPVTVAPALILAPPPMQIVLPPTESPAQVAASTGLPADPGKAGVTSKSIVGAIIQNNSGTMATPPTGSFAFQTTVGGQPVTFGGSQIGGAVSSFNDTTDARFGSGGGGGAGGATPSNSGAQAWHDSNSSANRLRTESGQSNPGEKLRRNASAGTADAQYGLGLPAVATASPQAKLPDTTLSGVTGENSVDRKREAKSSDQFLANGVRDGDNSANKFYRTPMRERADINGSVANPAAPMVTTAPTKPGSSTSREYFATDAIRPQSADDFKLTDKSGSGALVLSGGNTFAEKTAVASGNLARDAAPDSVSQQLAKNEVAGLRFIIATNSVVAPRLEGKLVEIQKRSKSIDDDKPLQRAQLPASTPQPEILTRENNFSTFSLNVSDVSFKLAAASLERGQMPDAASIRSEEFINAFDYRDPEAKWDSASSLSAPTGKMPVPQPIAFASERARYPFAQNHDLLRFSVKTAAAGRPAGRALNLVLLLDNSGSMERADRVAIIREALRVLATQLQPQDTVSVVTFARTARLWADGLPGDKAGETLARIGGITPEGGTNLEEAMRLAYETARRHYLANGLNRVVLLTDGAANLGDVDPADLKQKVEAQRKQGIALDCFGIGQQDYNDELLEQLSSNGDGRYAFLNSPEDASKEFAAKLTGALQIAASDVKVQVEFNPQRVISYRQIGYAKHQLTKEQFRDNTVDAAEIAAQEAGNALYTIETKPDGIGPVATVRVRYKVPGTTDYRERSWDVAYTGNAPALEQSSAAMRLAATASAFSEWLAASPFAQEVTPDELLKNLSGVPQIYGSDERPKKLEWMIRQAKSLSGK